MAVSPSPIGGFAGQFFDNNGDPLSGGKLYTYTAGTTTPQITYTTADGDIEHSNPITLDSAGRVPGGEIWLTDGVAYKFIIYTSTAILIGSYDNVSGMNDFSSLTPVIYNATGTGVQTAFTILPAPTSENTTNIYINGVYQQKNTYTVASTTLTFSEAPPLNATIEVSYF